MGKKHVVEVSFLKGQLDLKEVRLENVYYLFSSEECKFLAKKEGNVVTVYEAHELEGKLFAFPLFEVEV